MDKWLEQITGRLSREEDCGLTEHLQGCASCEETLARLLVPSYPSPRGHSPEPLPPALVERLRRLWDAGVAPADLTAPECWPRIEGYEILSVLGRGGMSVVYKARQLALGRVVALKMMAAGERSTAADVRHLLRDAATAAQLQHESIAPIYALGQHQGLPYCVMEWIAGGSLAEQITELVSAPREAARLIAAVARALHHAHVHGVCHRDVKPANILVKKRPGQDTPENEDQNASKLSLPLLTDFGLARRTREEAGLTRSGVVVGTPGYMAPEQIRSEQPTTSADVYGLGAVLYECLTGQPPFRGATSFDTLLMTLHKEPQRPRALNSRLPRDLETICLKCLEKEPARRYPSAAAVADDLERWLRGEPVRARPVGPLSRAGRWCRRRPLLAGLMAALVLTLTAGSFGVLYQWSQAETARREAEASDAQAQQLLGELLLSTPLYPLDCDYHPTAPTADRLLKAESHCAKFLRNRPEDTALRIALTRVRGALATQLLIRGQAAESDAWLQRARDLWEPLARQALPSPEAKSWLATTLSWQGYAARIRGDYSRALEHLQQTYALWLEVAEETPGDGRPGEQMADCRWNMLAMTTVARAREDILQPLERDRASLGRLVADDPSNTAYRKRLALTCLLLGELLRENRSEAKAVSHWQQAYEQYKLLATEAREDFLVPISLGLCCSRLMGDRPADRYYLEAVALHEQMAPFLAARVDQHPESALLRRAVLENYCTLAVCHMKAGQTARAEQVIKARLRPGATSASGLAIDPVYGVGLLRTLGYLAGSLRDAKQPAAALPLAREAAMLADRYAATPWPDLAFREWLQGESLALAVLLRHLAEPAEALRQAEQARRLAEELCHAAPDNLVHGMRLSNAWQQIGKARWELWQTEETLAAFRESAAVQRQVFERAPAIQVNRIALSRCYDRLALWNGWCGQRAEVAAALLEREKLWPDDAAELRRVARDFERLAQAVAESGGPLSLEAQRERQRYLDQSERTQRAAADAARAVAWPQVVTEGP